MPGLVSESYQALAQYILSKNLRQDSGSFHKKIRSVVDGYGVLLVTCGQFRGDSRER